MYDFTKEEVIGAISGSGGLITAVSQKLGVTWGTAKKFVDKWPETKEAISDENEKILDLAESKVIKAINADDIQTAKWLLGNKGKSRGYGITQIAGELTGGITLSVESDFLPEPNKQDDTQPNNAETQSET